MDHKNYYERELQRINENAGLVKDFAEHTRESTVELKALLHELDAELENPETREAAKKKPRRVEFTCPYCGNAVYVVANPTREHAQAFCDTCRITAKVALNEEGRDN